MEVITNASAIDYLLAAMFALVTLLLGVVAYFLKRQADKIDERFSNHSQKHDSVQLKLSDVDVRLSGAMTKHDVTAIYDWTSSELNRIRAQDIAPFRDELNQAQKNVTNEIKLFDSRLNEAFTNFRSEIREDMKLIIGMLKKNGD